MPKEVVVAGLPPLSEAILGTCCPGASAESVCEKSKAVCLGEFLRGNQLAVNDATTTLDIVGISRNQNAGTVTSKG